MFSASGGLSSQQQKKVRADKRQAVAQMYEAEYKRVMSDLNAAIKVEQGRAKEELQALRERCAAEREAVSAEAEAEFEAALIKLRSRRQQYLSAVRAEHTAQVARLKKEREELSAAIKALRKQWPDIFKGERLAASEEFERFVEKARAEREEKVKEARSACMARGSSALLEAKARLEKLRRDKAERAGDKRFSKAYNKTRRDERPKVTAKQRAKERQEESDDEVRNNIEPRLVPLFEMFKERVKGNDRLSRTEQFVQMYEEDKGNMDALLWQEEEQATTRFLEAQYKQHKEEQEAKERLERRRSQKKVQTQFADGSGTALAGKKTKQTSILDTPRKKNEKNADTALFGVPF